MSSASLGRRPFGWAASLTLVMACSGAPEAQQPTVGGRAKAEADNVRYCEDTDWTVSEIVCRGPIAESAMAHRERAVKITRDPGGTVMVEHLSRETGRDLRRWQVRFENGEMHEERIFAGSGMLVAVGLFDRGRHRERLVDLQGRPYVATRPDALLGTYSTIEFERDARGFEVKRRYLSASGRPAVNHYGAHAIHFERDAQGLEIESRAFDIAGKPIGHADGAHRWVMKRDAATRVVRLERYDAKDRPFPGWWSGAVEEISYDDWGNPIRVRELDSTGKVFREFHVTRDSEGATARTKVVDAAGELVENGAGNAQTDYVYDDRGRITELAFFGSDGKLNQKTKLVYDAKNREIAAQWFNPEGERIGGYDFELDDRDLLTRSTRLLGKGKLGETYAIRLDDRGRPIERRYLDPNGRIDPNRHCPRATYAYDEDGLVPQITCTDHEGQVVEVIVYRMLRTKDEARAKEALARIRAGENYRDVALMFGSRTAFRDEPVEDRMLRVATPPQKPFFGELAAADVGEVVGVVQINADFLIGIRER